MIKTPDFCLPKPINMTLFLKFILCFIPVIGFSQVVDFENLSNLEPGDPVGVITLEEEDYNIQFYIGHNIEDTIPLKFEKVAHNSGAGGFYGPESHLDCEGQTIVTKRINQINAKNFALNPEITNRERVGCHFISGILLGEVLPSIFIFYDKPVKGCSADLLDVDGHENTIEAYDIYCYSSYEDYPLKPINNDPIEIRSIGRTFGPGILGDNGGVMPFNIDFTVGFTLIEIRPIQQVSGGNEIRNEFGFALDNYSPISVEQAPYIPPYLAGEDNDVTVAHNDDSKEKFAVNFIEEQAVESPIERTFTTWNESIYFDFDESNLTSAAKKILDDIVDDVLALKKMQPKMEISLDLSGFTDPKGNEAYNQRLSKKRVDAAATYLMQHDVEASLIKKSHHGENYSGNTNDTDAKKRTVQIKLNYRKA
jgi:outer membrane protein OmpA-like peptidoglycan-associated protein